VGQKAQAKVEREQQEQKEETNMQKCKEAIEDSWDRVWSNKRRRHQRQEDAVEGNAWRYTLVQMMIG